MTARRFGGSVASPVRRLIIFGAARSTWARRPTTVHDSMKQEQISFGEAADPAVAKYADQWAGQQVKTGEQARAFANIMRTHTLEATGGLTYAQMGRFQSAANPADQKGTNDEAAAAKDESGHPIANGARNIWVTETALTTALNTSYMASQLSVFGIVVGIALLLTGVGLMILALAVFGGRFREEAVGQPRVTTKVAIGH